MKRTLLLPYVFLIPYLFSPDSAFSQDTPRFSAKVKLIVSSDSNTMEVKSYLSRELRSLSDVAIVENDPDWELLILAMTTVTKGGMESGIVFSVVILKPMNNTTLKFWLVNAGKLNPDQLAFVDSAKLDLCNFQGQWVQTGPKEDMRYICQKIVAKFDTDYLEKERQWYREAVDYIKKIKRNK